MPIKFSCSCGQTLTVKDEFAGKTGTCPACKKRIAIPALPTAAPLEVEPEDRVRPRHRRHDDVPPFRARRPRRRPSATWTSRTITTPDLAIGEAMHAKSSGGSSFSASLSEYSFCWP